MGCCPIVGFGPLHADRSGTLNPASGRTGPWTMGRRLRFHSRSTTTPDPPIPPAMRLPMLDFAQARRMMVDCQLRTFDVNDLALLSAMDEVPRERFVPEGREAFAYIDKAIPVSDDADALERRAMLAPMVLARLIQALGLERGETVLDVACGLGYSCAVMARLGAVVTRLEQSETLAEAARARLGRCGFGTVAVVAGPLDRGWRERAPYRAILVNGALEVRPQALLEQLA